MVSELSKLSEEEMALVRKAVERILSGHCFQCGEKVLYMRQVYQAIYAEPCGHRNGIGNARGYNEEHGLVAPEGVHTDPDGLRYDQMF